MYLFIYLFIYCFTTFIYSRKIVNKHALQQMAFITKEVKAGSKKILG